MDCVRDRGEPGLAPAEGPPAPSPVNGKVGIAIPPDRLSPELEAVRVRLAKVGAPPIPVPATTSSGGGKSSLRGLSMCV